LVYFARHFIILIEFFYIDYTTNLLKILFPKKIKSPSGKYQRAGNVMAPQTERFSQLLYEGGDGESVSEVRRSSQLVTIRKVLKGKSNNF
jgi:hypothetical protein